MATAEIMTEPSGPQAPRRRPFSTWVKKLTHFKTSSDGERSKRTQNMRRKPKLNNPYPQSGRVGIQRDGGSTNASSREHSSGPRSISFVTVQTGSLRTSSDGPRSSVEGQAPQTAGGRSLANTMSTDNERQSSIIAPSQEASSMAGTNRTVGGGFDSRRGGDSTFSSPAPSVRSLTTTLTTIQSMAPHGNPSSTSTQANTQSIQFSQPFPTASPASAIPAHLAPTGHPTTYTAATANNLLTDNASILTLASSSKRRRRRSMDTDASVRALAPSSLWGGSRESLPMSVLSGSVDPSGNPTTPGLHGSTSRIGIERTSIYSASATAPSLAAERNSLYAKPTDGASVRSGLLSHGRPDSISGHNVTATSPLASPREVSDPIKVANEKEEAAKASKDD